MLIEILFFEGCPNHLLAVDMVREILRALDVEADVREVDVATPELAKELRFLGSPSIRVDGIDIEPSARERTDFGYSCRTYDGAGLPAREMLVQAIAGESGGGTSISDSGSKGLKSVWLIPGAVFAAALSSACCWLPLILISAGLSAGTMGIWFESARPYFLAVTSVLLAAGFYLTYRKQPVEASCAECSGPASNTKRVNRIVLWVSTAGVAAFTLFPYYTSAFAVEPIGSNYSVPTAQQITYDLHIEGMTCEGCATVLNNAWRDMDGVVDSMIRVDDGFAKVTLDGDAPAAMAQVIEAVTRSGFSVKDTKEE